MVASCFWNFFARLQLCRRLFLTTPMLIDLLWIFGEGKYKIINPHLNYTCQQEEWKSDFRTSKLQFEHFISFSFHAITLFSDKIFYFEKEQSKCFQYFPSLCKRINLLSCLRQTSPFNDKCHALLRNQNKSKRKTHGKIFLLYEYNTLFFYKDNFIRAMIKKENDIQKLHLNIKIRFK